MPYKRYPAELLRRLRNDIPIDWLIGHLGWPRKTNREGKFIFVCPLCGESESDVKRETNLGRCFHCETNFNTIEFVMRADACDFVPAVELLITLLPKT